MAKERSRVTLQVIAGLSIALVTLAFSGTIASIENLNTEVQKLERELRDLDDANTATATGILSALGVQVDRVDDSIRDVRATNADTRARVAAVETEVDALAAILAATQD